MLSFVSLFVDVLKNFVHFSLEDAAPMAVELRATNKDKVFPRQKQVEIMPYASKEELSKTRFYRDLGFGIKTPETAINATYVDKKCPFTGEVVVRGRIFKAVVHSMKTERTIVVVNRYLNYDKKYKRYARMNSKKLVHMSPCFDGMIKVGDTVVCGETRPLSKNISSVVLAVEPKNVTEKEKIFEGY